MEIVGQTIKFAATVTEAFDDFAGHSEKHSYFRFFSTGPPKVATTHVDQMVLFAGALSFFIHALDRASFRKQNETLREVIFDTTAIGLSDLYAKMIGKLNAKHTATAKEDLLSHINLRGLQYSEAPSLFGKSAEDRNSAVWLAACTIAEDIDYPKHAFSVLLIQTELMRALVELNIVERVKAIEVLL
jgi:hypothetical protein